MKPENYGTPLTDRQVAITSQVPSRNAPEIVRADFARDLERKLVMCWEALDFIKRNVWDYKGIIATAAIEALAATEPKL